MSARQVSHRNSVQAGRDWSSILILLIRAANSLGLSRSTRRRGCWCPAATPATGTSTYARLNSMTNPGGDSSETPASDSGSEASEPSAGGYESPPIEQSQQQADAGAAEPQVSPPSSRRVSPHRAVHSAGIRPAVVGLRSTAGYQPPTAYQQPDYQQPGYRPPAYPPPPSYPDPGPNSRATRRPTLTRPPTARSRITAPSPIPHRRHRNMAARRAIPRRRRIRQRATPGRIRPVMGSRSPKPTRWRSGRWWPR